MAWISWAAAQAPVQIEGVSAELGDRVAVLWGVLILGVVVLGWMAWQLSRQLNASEPAPVSSQTPAPPLKSKEDARDSSS